MQSRLYFLLVLSTFCLTSCWSGTALKSDLQEYQSRLQTILSLDIKLLSPPVSLQYPRRADLTLAPPELSMNLRDFYAIQDCPVNSLIAQRNTPMGKLQLPSSRFVYETTLIKQLKLCLASTDNQQRKNQLTQWLVTKQSHLSQAWAYMLQNSDEIRQQLASNEQYIQGNERDRAKTVVRALSYIIEAKKHHSINSQHLEQQLNILRQHTLIANSWRTQKLLQQQLQQINKWLAPRIEQYTCEKPQTKQTVEYLSNVFELFFLRRIQPLAGQLNNYHYQYQPVLQQIIDDQDVSVTFKAYLQQHLAHFKTYQHTMGAHIQMWQALFKRCGVSPQSLAHIP